MDGGDGQPPRRRRRFDNQQVFNIPQPQLLNPNQVPVPVAHIPLPPLPPDMAHVPPPPPPAGPNDLIRQLRDLFTNAVGAERTAALPSIPLPAKYRGRSDKRDFETFLKEMYRVRDYYGWNNARLVRLLPTLLEGEALSLFDGLPTATQTDWHLVCDVFYQRFTSPNDLQRLQRQLQNRKQHEHESVYEFAAAIYDLVQKAHPTQRSYTNAQQTDIAINCFRHGLKPSIRPHVLRRTMPRDMDAAINDALAEEQIEQSMREDYELTSVNALTSQLPHAIFPSSYPSYHTSCSNHDHMPSGIQNTYPGMQGNQNIVWRNSIPGEAFDDNTAFEETEDASGAFYDPDLFVDFFPEEYQPTNYEYYPGQYNEYSLYF